MAGSRTCPCDRLVVFTGHVVCLGQSVLVPAAGIGSDRRQAKPLPRALHRSSRFAYPSANIAVECPGERTAWPNRNRPLQYVQGRLMFLVQESSQMAMDCQSEG